MDLAPKERELRDRFLQAMLEAALPLQAGLDQEMTLQALIRAAESSNNALSKNLTNFGRRGINEETSSSKPSRSPRQTSISASLKWSSAYRGAMPAL